jgi:hypothetical protein
MLSLDNPRVADLAVPCDRVRLLHAPLLILGCVAAACAQQSNDRAGEPAGCSARVILALQAAPDDALFADLGRVSGAKLELVRAMTSNLYLFVLSSARPEPDCSDAIERLRRDPRVGAADFERRREIQSP